MMRFAVLLVLSPFLLTQAALAADWPLDRADAARSGYTDESLSRNVQPVWTWRATHAPVPAWPRDDRMLFDRAYRVVAADGTLFFGSSADGKVYALDAATGAVKWTFFTEGPIRFAPAVWNGQVYVGSDDGYLYCLAARDGALIRKWSGAPQSERVLGNSRVIARHPVRGGPVILDDILYYAAGIWQSERIHIHALDLASGETLWTNDTSGGLVMPQPHGGAVAKSGVSAQGHLVADDEHLYVPTGRAVPAVFDRQTGEFQYYHLQANTRRGGTPTVVSGRFVYNGGHAFETADGTRRTTFGAGVIAASPDGILFGSGGRLRAYHQVVKDAVDRKGQPIRVPDHEADWSVGGVPAGTSLIVAGETIITGGEGAIALIDRKSQEKVAEFAVDGFPHSLAVADGRLYASTDQGHIHCFAIGSGAEPRVVEREPDESPYGENDRLAAAAEEIIAKSGITAGYCVDLGCGDGGLAYELAKRTRLHIVCVESDPRQVAAARAKLDAAGLYGDRVSVHLADPSDTKFPKYFANLVVSSRSVAQGADWVPEDEAFRLQRPYGGVACFGRPTHMQSETRGPLETAGSWSHLYCNPANTSCSLDEVKGPLRVLWYRDVDLELPQRHGRGPSPLFHEGRLFAEGMDQIRGVDAYNGRTLWTFALPGVLHAYNADHIVGTSGTGSNFCAAGDSVYVRQGSTCYRLDTATGKLLGKFTAPEHKDGKPARWGYIACVDGVLFGSGVNEEHIVRHAWHRADEEMKQLFTESHFLFALDAETGELLWRYDAKDSIRHNAIAIGDGRVFLIDRPVATGDLLSKVAARRGKQPAKTESQQTGTLVMLDAKTGERKWDNDKDIFGTMLVFSKRHDMLLMCYQSTRFRLPSEVGGRMAVFHASDGYRIWDKKMKYITRPLVNDQTIIAQGGAWSLLSGEAQPFEFKRSYGCGQLAGSKNLLLFHSATLGYKDLTRDAGTESYGGVRPGCWINSLPAGGLVLVPDASAGCSCSYQNRSWMALQGSE